MGLREAKRAAQRQQILEVCERLYRERGFDETTVDEILAALGISRQTFFNYFPSKQAVLREIGMEWIAEQARRSLQERPGQGEGDLLPGLRALLVAQLRAIEADRDFMAMVFTRSGLFFPTGPELGSANDEARVDRTRGAFEVIAAGVRGAQERGEIRREVDPQQVAEIYVAVFYVTTRLWLTDYRANEGALEDRMLAALDILMSGLRPRDAMQRK